ncbi:MAG: CDP-alcohol phosphatidyltransferase family protein [bacterium]|nr:CDP-alcohol phosphatidyltransferase family protein [bacterium]
MPRGFTDSPGPSNARPPATGIRRQIPNLLSVTRLVMLPVVLYLVTLPDAWAPWAAAGLMIFSMAFDGLDGLLARRWNAVTEFGKVIDPVADKVCIGAAAVVLVIYRDFPLWLAVVVLGRDALILLGGCLLRHRRRETPMSSYAGKAAAFVIGATLVVYTLRTGHLWLETALSWICAFLVAVSLAVYLYRYFRLMREKGADAASTGGAHGGEGR